MPTRTLSLTLLAVALAAAEDAPTLIVTAERSETEQHRAVVSVEVVEAGDLRDRGHALNGHDWLRELPGVVVLNRNGGVDGGLADIRIRGVDPAFTQILIDGLPLNDPTAINGDLNPSLVNPAGIERVEVLKGGQSGLYGSRALGGVIDFRTARPTPEHRARLKATGGSFGTVGGEGTATGPLGKDSGYAASVSGLASRGFSSTTASPDGDPKGHEDDALRRWSGSLRLEHRPAEGSTLYVSGFMQRAFQQYDEFSPEDELPSNTVDTVRVVGGGSHAADTWSASADVAYATIDRDNRTNYGPPPGFAATTTHYRGRELFAQARVEAKPIEGLRLAVGGDWRGEQAEQADVTAGTIWEDRASTVGTYAQAGWDAGRASLSLVGRFDRHDAFGEALTGRAAGAVWPVEDVLKLRASVANAFRAPSLYQLHGAADFGGGFTFAGNPDLEPETAVSYEAGLDWYPAAHTDVGVTAFRTEYRRKIIYDSMSSPNTYANLASEAWSHGAEAAARSRDVGGSGVDLSAWATWLRSEDGAGNELAYVPRASGGGRATLRQDAGRLQFWQSVGVSRSTGFATGSAGANVVPGYTLADVTVGATIDRTWEVSVRVDNALDEDYVLTSSFGTTYTTSPRAVYATVEARF